LAEETPQENRTAHSIPAPEGGRGKAIHATRFLSNAHFWLWFFALVLFSYNAFILWNAVRSSNLTMADFSTFFVAGKLFNAGKAHQLYDIAAQAQMQLSPRFRQLPLPFIHAPYEAALFSPLALLPYQTSYYVWNLVNLTLLALMAWRLQPWLESGGGIPVPLIFLLSLAYWPNVMVLLQGQDSILVAVLITEAFIQLKQDRDERAGVIFALGLFKFHLVLPLIACFAMNRQWKLLKSFTAAASGLAAVCLAMIGTSGVLQFFNLLPSLSRMPLAIYIQPEQMPNLRGVIATWLSAAPDLIGVSVLVASVVVFSAVVLILPGEDRARKFDLFFACATAMSYALSFHSYEHDMAPMFPGLLLAANAAVKSESFGWKFACLGLIAVLFFSPLYLFLYYRRLLCLMCVPLVSLIAVLCVIAARTPVEAE
jgi:glycosyl transferase family 87